MDLSSVLLARCVSLFLLYFTLFVGFSSGVMGLMMLLGNLAGAALGVVAEVRIAAPYIN